MRRSRWRTYGLRFFPEGWILTLFAFWVHFGRSGQGFKGEVACLPADSAPTPWKNGGSIPRVHPHYPEQLCSKTDSRVALPVGAKSPVS